MSSSMNSSLTSICPKCSPRPVFSTKLSSRERELLKSNEPLSNGELAAFSTEVVNKRDRLGDLNILISIRVQELQGLLRERDTIHRRLNYLPKIINPVRRLPAEILQHIFALSMDKDEDSGFVHFSLDTTKSPWVFTHVSQKWREIASGCPLLWSYVGLNAPCLDAREPAVMSRMAFLLGAQLHRSKSSILAVSLASRGGLKVGNPLLQLIRPTSPLWERLFIDIPLPCMSALSAIEGFLPLLREIHHHVPSNAATFTNHIDQKSSFRGQILRFVPKLSSITTGTPLPVLQGFGLTASKSITTYHESTLGTRSHLLFPDHRRHSLMLPKLTNLRICTLELSKDTVLQLTSARRGTISLPLLDDLTVRNYSGSAEPSIQLFQRLHIPTLRRLEIVGCFDPTVVASCAHSLHVLEVHYLKLTDKGALTILREVPLVQEATIGSRISFTDLFVQQLCALSEGDCPLVCPRLQILKTFVPPLMAELCKHGILQLKSSRPALDVAVYISDGS